MDTCADITTIHIDRDILEKDKCLKRIQFNGCMIGYELSLVLSAAEQVYREASVRSRTDYNAWNEKADKNCQIITKHDLPLAKKEKNLKAILRAAASMEAMKAAAVSGGSLNGKAARAWLSTSILLQKGAPVRITRKQINSFISLFWSADYPDIALTTAYFSEILYKPLDFLSDFMPDGTSRIRSELAPLFESSFTDALHSTRKVFSMSCQGEGTLKGVIGEHFAEEIFRYVIKHGAYSKFHVHSISERLSLPYIYQYEDFDGILAPNVFWDAKNIQDDLMILLPDVATNDPSDDLGEASINQKSPEVLKNSLKNKIQRMPANQMNYLIYFSTRFIGNRKSPVFYRPKRKTPLGMLCKETERKVTVIVISSLFTENDTGMSRLQKHKRLMSVIGDKVLGKMLREESK